MSNIPESATDLLDSFRIVGILICFLSPSSHGVGRKGIPNNKTQNLG